jgi:hypothetical protein
MGGMVCVCVCIYIYIYDVFSNICPLCVRGRYTSVLMIARVF